MPGSRGFEGQDKVSFRFLRVIAFLSFGWDRLPEARIPDPEFKPDRNPNNLPV